MLVKVFIISTIRYFIHIIQIHRYIDTFLEILKKIQIDIKLAIQTTRNHKKTSSNKIVFIKDNINQFKNNKISRLDFVENGI